MVRIVLTERNFSKLKDEIKKHNGDEIVFSSDDDELNRKVAEKLAVNVIGIPLSGRKDFSKQRNSGLNEVVARIVKKNGIKIGIFLDEIIFSKEKEKIISRVRQNIKLCNKNKIEMIFIEGKEKRNSVLLKSLGSTLGMPTWMTKKI